MQANAWLAAGRAVEVEADRPENWLRSSLVLAMLLLASGCLSGCINVPVEPVFKQDYIMDTSIALTINATDVAAGEAVAATIFERLRDIDAKVRVQSSESEAFAVNAAAGKEPVTVSDITFAVASIAVDLAKLSGGAFDPTIGPVSSLWNIESEDPHVPNPAELAIALSLVDWRLIVLNDSVNTIALERQGMRLDFGGVAKGYAALEAARLCREAGVNSALLNMGDSSIYALGTKPGGGKWRIGIQNPAVGPEDGVERGKMLGVVAVADQVVESSGTYERYFVQDGKQYHHIMNPETGFPVDNGLVQVTLIVPGDTHFADGLSTSVFVLGPEKGLRLVESLPGVAAILVFADQRVLLSSRAKGLFSLDAEGFTLVESGPASVVSPPITAPAAGGK